MNSHERREDLSLQFYFKDKNFIIIIYLILLRPKHSKYAKKIHGYLTYVQVELNTYPVQTMT
jgi:hypothetical protein